MSANAMTLLHQGMERLGPGEAADVEWLGSQIELPDNALIADLACGVGSDIGPLLNLTPKGSVVASDHNPDFLLQAGEQWGSQLRVDIRLADMAEPGGRFDLIWCAGAIYFMGITKALNVWKSSVNVRGYVAFSEPCFWSKTPSKVAAGIWEEYPAMTDEAGIEEQVKAAGFETIATRRLSIEAWSAYYTPLLERIGELRHDADAQLRQVLEGTLAEIVAWNEYGDEYGYLLSIVAPK